MTVKSEIIALMAAGVILPVFIVSAVIIKNIFALTPFRISQQQSQSEISYVDTIFSMYLNNLAENVAFSHNQMRSTRLSPGSIKSYATSQTKKS